MLLVIGVAVLELSFMYRLSIKIMHAAVSVESSSGRLACVHMSKIEALIASLSLLVYVAICNPVGGVLVSV